MTKAASSLRNPVLSLLAVSALLLGVGLLGASQPAGDVKLETSTTVAAAGDWQRPAPLTWSSRFETRWTARWGATPKYIV